MSVVDGKIKNGFMYYNIIKYNIVGCKKGVILIKLNYLFIFNLNFLFYNMF